MAQAKLPKITKFNIPAVHHLTIYVAQFLPLRRSDFFRMFVQKDSLIASLGESPACRHPCWLHPFTIWEVDFFNCSTRNVTDAILKEAKQLDKTKHLGHELHGYFQFS